MIDNTSASPCVRLFKHKHITTHIEKHPPVTFERKHQSIINNCQPKKALPLIKRKFIDYSAQLDKSYCKIKLKYHYPLFWSLKGDPDQILEGANLIEMLLTQWRSSVGVLKPSPLNTCPRWPPHAVQVISVRLPSASNYIKKTTEKK